MATTSRSARYAKWLSIPLGLVISALLIWQASYAAFTDEVRSPDNTWTAGTVTLGPNDRISTLFDEDIVPGSSKSKEIKVTYTGTLDAMVTFSGENYTSTDGFGEHILLRIDGSEGPLSGNVFDGTLEEFSALSWTFPATGKVPREGTFNFTYSVASDVPQSIQGGSASIDFVLESRSTSAG